MRFSPVFDLPPVAAAVFMIIASVAAVLVIRVLAEGGLYLTRWKAFRFGELIGLPVFAYFGSSALRGYQYSNVFYDQDWWSSLLLVGGIAYSLWLEIDVVIKKNRPLRNAVLPSELYHALFLAFAMAWIAEALLPLGAVFLKTYSIEVVIAFIGVGFHLWMLYLDRNGWKLGAEAVPRGLSGPGDLDR